ncbi:TonB-dependent siderophore receptor [Halomicronema hongdechloris C2206]|uniref:TonB-dependent siderophore receptor n=1 Tax=Halomicronema hongdechloris C2206 TaxID=1641165 RepID=A0A1Z3HN96_9CYAN|nr:TonB-dependent siderophore receptor [Halomicronema hongdechloris]ASC71760.1 TonB-dependent siderophore receptor [Halomicronema hongdechloris C2206]
MVDKLQRLLLLAGVLALVPLSPGAAETEDRRSERPRSLSAEASQLDLAQGLVQITDVQVDTSATGLRLVLETSGTLTAPETTTAGNALTAEIPNAVLALPDGDSFEVADPIDGIARVALTNLAGDRVQVSITGIEAPPTTDVSVEATGLVLSVVPGVAAAAAADEEALQILVTGERSDYVPTEASVTRLDVPLRDTPRSIQVVPRQVIEDQAANRVGDALRNVSNVVRDGGFGGTADQFIMRGFFLRNIFRDGFRDPTFSILETSNIERIEVIKGPASVLQGNLEPGGAINVVTEQPLANPRYEAQLRAGSFGFIRPTADLSGPLTDAGDLRYRVNLAYEGSDGFRDLDQDVERVFVSPVLAWDITDDTTLTLEFSYLDSERPFDRGLVASGRDVADIPVRRFLGEPDDFYELEEISAGYRLEHQFNDQWGIRNAFRFLSSDTVDFRAEPLNLNEATGELTRNFRSNDDLSQTYLLQTEVNGRFNTGSLEHNVLLGFDLSRVTDGGTQSRLPAGLTPSINIFNPVYNQVTPPSFAELTNVVRDNFIRTDSIGIFAQDQIELTDNLQLLLAGRVDFVEQRSENNLTGTSDSQSPTAFSPSIGLLYRPVEPLALYASFSRSFQPNFGTDIDGNFLDPERGTQYEVGLRAELLQGNLIANLAVFHINRSGLATFDAATGAFVPTAEQRSRGVELDISGEILPGWNVIASVGYIDAEFTEEFFGLEPGSRVDNVPEHTASLWTTYEIQSGDLQGLGFGAGVFHVGERAGDFGDTFDLPGYWRTDAAVFYNRDNWRAAINVQNLFDVRYFTANNFGRVAIEPGAPLTIIGTLSVEF